jgi:phage-related tail protein
LKKHFVTVLLLLVVAGRPLGAQDHIATGPSVETRVAERAAERERNLATVSAVLDSEAAAKAAAIFGADVSRIRAGLSYLGDAELRDLAARASRLQQDPVAGLSHDVNELLIIFLIVAIVVVVLKAVG